MQWNSILTKLIMAFVLVMLPLYALSIQATFIGSDQMKREIDKSNVSKLLFHYNHLEFELTRMSNLIKEYANDYEMVNFPTLYPALSEYDISVQLNDFYRKLRQIQVSSPYIEDVMYFVPAAGKRVSSLSGISDYDKKILQGMLASRGNLRSSISYYRDGYYFMVGIPFNLDSSSEPNFLLAFKLNTAEMIRTLNGFATGEGGGAALLFGDGEASLASQGMIAFDLKAVSPEEDQLSTLTDNVRSRDLGDSRIYMIDNVNYGIRLVETVPKKMLRQPIAIYGRWLWIITLFSFLIIIVFSFWIVRLIHRPLGKLTRAFKLVEVGLTNGDIPHKRKDDFGFIYTKFNEMLHHLRTLIADNYVQRIRSQDAELKQLQSQITPHFLYNSLFTIKQMAEMEDVDGIKEFSGYLGSYFQYITRNAEQTVSLKEELTHAISYMSLQEIRFAPRVTVTYEEIPARFKRILVPKLVVQPLIENGFEHGVRENSGKGRISLTYKLERDYVAIVVEDNGEHLLDDKLAELSENLQDSRVWNQRTEITGLLNVHHRVQIRYGVAYGITVARSAWGGMRIELKIPHEEMITDAATVDRG